MAAPKKSAPKKAPGGKRGPQQVDADARYEAIREQLVALLAGGLSFHAIALELKAPTTTVYRWSQREEIPALVAAERQKRAADREHVRLARLVDAHDLAWKVAQGTVEIKNDDQRKQLAYFMGLDAAAIATTTPNETPALTEGQPAQPAGMIPPGTAVLIQLNNGAREPIVIKGEPEDDRAGADESAIEAV